MSSMMIGTLGTVFSVALMLGVWAEETQRRSPVKSEAAWWLPAALGVLRAEVVMVQGLLILLVTRPVSWVPGGGLVLLAVWAGAARFVRVAQPEPRLRWGWLAAGAMLAAVWVLFVGVFLPAPGLMGERVATAVVVVGVMCGFLLGVRGLAWCAAHLADSPRRASCPSEYVAVPELPSRP